MASVQVIAKIAVSPAVAEIRLSKPVLQSVIVAVGLVYLIQAFSPLRLNHDNVELLGLAASVAEGRGFLYYGEPSRFPPGYPAIIAVLDRLGLAASSTFILLNCLFVVLGLVASFKVLRRSLNLQVDASLLCCALSVLSFILTKQIPTPGSDCVFFGLTATALWLLIESEQSTATRRWPLLLSAALLCAACVSVRTIGIALIPALIFVTIRNRRAMLIGLSVTVLAVLLISVRTTYVSMALEIYDKAGGMSGVGRFVVFHLCELGELVVNVPFTRMPETARPLMAGIGLLVLVAVLAGILRHRRSAVSVFGLSYFLIIFVWSYYDPRFWLPVLPLMFAWIALGIEPWLKIPRARLMTAAILAYFLVTGAGTLVYTTRITFGGSRFPEMYGDGTLTPTYRAARGEDAARDRIIPEALDVLERYGAW